MRVVAISDTHGAHEMLHLPEGDLLIHAGDFTNLGTYPEIRSFLRWMKEQPFKHKVLVAGNHDIGMQREYYVYRPMLQDAGVTFLQDSGATIEGISIWGSPWCNPFMNWAYMCDDAKQRERFAFIPDRLDILVTHSPPYGILSSLKDNIDVGSRALLDAILARDISHHVFGHNHNYGGKMLEVGRTWFHNAAVLNESYKMAQTPTVFEIAATAITVG